MNFKTNPLATTLVLVLVVAMLALTGVVLQMRADRRDVTVGKYTVCLHPKTAPDPAPTATFEELQKDPHVIEISCKEPDPNGGEDDYLWTDWTPRRGYIHNQTHFKRGQ